MSLTSETLVDAYRERGHFKRALEAIRDGRKPSIHKQEDAVSIATKVLDQMREAAEARGAERLEFQQKQLRQAADRGY